MLETRQAEADTSPRLKHTHQAPYPRLMVLSFKHKTLVMCHFPDCSTVSFCVRWVRGSGARKEYVRSEELVDNVVNIFFYPKSYLWKTPVLHAESSRRKGDAANCVVQRDHLQKGIFD